MRCVAEEFSGAVGPRSFMHDAVRDEARWPGVEPTAPACAGHRLSRIACVGILTLLTACGKENRFIAPPLPKVTVELPVQQMVTPYLEATGNTAAVNTVELTARVQGYVQEIKYQDGAAVKKGTPLFVIEPQPYKVQLEQAQAAEEGAKATLINAEAEFTRQQQLEAKDVTTQASLDRARANRDTARKVSIGELVGGNHTSELASIDQLDPIWVWFNPSERDVQRARDRMVERGVNVADLVNKLPVEAGLQTETGYPHKGVLNYTAPDVNQSTGTLKVRGIFENAKHALLPGYFVRVRVPRPAEQALLVPEVAVGSDQAGRYVLTVNADAVVEQRRVQLGQTTGEMRVIETGLKPDERVVVAGILVAVPGQKVDPQLQTPKSGAAEPARSN